MNSRVKLEKLDDKRVSVASGKRQFEIEKENLESVIKHHTAPSETTSTTIGEVVWLMNQSPVHQHLSVADLGSILFPPILLGQYKLFRDGNLKPAGVVFWAYLSQEAEQKLKTEGRIAPEDWGSIASEAQGREPAKNNRGILWVVELVTPFHTEQNRHREKMLADLHKTVLKDKKVKMMRINPEIHSREKLS